VKAQVPQRVQFHGRGPRIQPRPPSLLPLRHPEQRLLTTRSINWIRSQPTSLAGSRTIRSMCQMRNLSLRLWRPRSRTSKSRSRCSRTRRVDIRFRIARTRSLSLFTSLLLRSQRHLHKTDLLRLRRRRRLTAETTHSSSRLPSRSRSRSRSSRPTTRVRLRVNSRITLLRTILSLTNLHRNTPLCSSLSRISLQECRLFRPSSMRTRCQIHRLPRHSDSHRHSCSRSRSSNRNNSNSNSNYCNRRQPRWASRTPTTHSSQ